MTETPKKSAADASNKQSNDPTQKRAPDDLTVAEKERLIKERNLDETLADSFPSSDPPSSIPNPGEEEDAA